MSRGSNYDIAVLGCGLMGSAMARRFSSSGLKVTAWNRTPGRAEALAADGVVPAATVEEAVAHTRLVVVCMSNTDATLATLDAAPSLDGTTIVNVSDGTREDVEGLMLWLTERGANFLDGKTFCYPEQIGDQDAMLVFSGPATVWAEHGPTLMLLGGRTRHLSDDIAAATELYLGSSAFFSIALAGFIESADYLLRLGRSLEEIRGITLYCLELLRYATEPVASAIATERHETDQATIDVFAHGVRRIVGEMQAAGTGSSVTEALQTKLEAAVLAGNGHLGYAAQVLI
ncbi:hypothetical protein FZI85_08615 [Mycobacterium sp. CBMA293]|nr:hypothetical protein [Mycolicibacterium sp. CBMA 360]MUL57146.1 hypothetical protein [Mycolicibacterium sp. CBMA 335]MUL70186.1 hypothetical protein [Mycolicibacterium sp. CBMA 311]MUL92234.1 hypothetical protein [Mycolicibacterium sp. CBMA 230]MUM04832.1 hypothetical protein [Mycolicibacterium sp. CBMA 213]MUM11090.1 hypothetical protein [Mycolicibacterium sp. CBMA 293]